MRLQLSSCTVDLDTLRLWRAGEEDTLTATEARLLRYLAARRGSTVDANELLHEVWGYSPKALSKTVSTTVGRLRAKIEADPRNPVHLLTGDGGYRLELPTPPRVSGPTFGRTELIDAVHAHLRSERRLTLVGPAGIGKSHVAREVASRYPSVTVDLTDVRDVVEVRDAVAAALGVASDDVDVLGNALAARQPLLLVLDAVEGVDARELVERWLALAPELRVLATSQVDDGGGLRLPPLSHDAARRLFLHHAHAVRPTLIDGPAVDDVVRGLDAVPLGLRLAAGWLDVVDLADIDAVPLDGALARSWALVEPERREALASVAVFQGPFDARAARACGLGPDDLRMAVRRSWVERHTDGFVLLDSIRAFLAPMTPRAARVLHVDWAREHGDVADLFAASTFCGGTDVAIALRLDARLAQRGARRRLGLLASMDVDVTTRARLVKGHAEALLQLGYGDRAIAFLEEELPGIRANAPSEVAAVLTVLGHALTSTRGPLEAREVLDEAVERGKGVVRVDALRRRSRLRRLITDFEGALDDVVAARSLAERSGDASCLARTLHTEGNLRFWQHDIEGAISALSRALELGGSRLERAKRSADLGRFLGRGGDLDGARTLLAQAIALAASEGAVVPQINACMALGELAWTHRDTDTALRVLHDAAAIAARTESRRYAAGIANALAQVHLDRGDAALALEQTRFAVAEWVAMGNATRPVLR